MPYLFNSNLFESCCLEIIAIFAVFYDRVNRAVKAAILDGKIPLPSFRSKNGSNVDLLA